MSGIKDCHLKWISEAYDEISSKSNSSKWSAYFGLKNFTKWSKNLRLQIRNQKNKWEQRHKKLNNEFQNISSNFKELAKSFSYQRDWEAYIESKFESLIKVNAQIIDSVYENGGWVRI